MYIVGSEVKGRISKRVFQENRAHQVFRKTNVSYPLTRTRTCAYYGVRNVRFSENLPCFVFLKHPFWYSPFCLITDDMINESVIRETQELRNIDVYFAYPLLTEWKSDSHKTFRRSLRRMYVQFTSCVEGRNSCLNPFWICLVRSAVENQRLVYDCLVICLYENGQVLEIYLQHIETN